MQDFPKKLLNRKREIQPQNEREIFITFLPANGKEIVEELSYKNEDGKFSNKSTLRVENDMVNASSIKNDVKEEKEKKDNRIRMNGSELKNYLAFQNNEEFERLDSFNSNRNLNAEKFNIIGDTTEYLLDLPIRNNEKKKVLKEIDYDLLYINDIKYKNREGVFNKTFSKLQTQSKNSKENSNPTFEKKEIIEKEKTSHIKRQIKPPFGVQKRNQHGNDTKQNLKIKSKKVFDKARLIKKRQPLIKALGNNLLKKKMKASGKRELIHPEIKKMMMNFERSSSQNVIRTSALDH